LAISPRRCAIATTIGSLIVDLRASTAAFAKDLDKASQLSFNTGKQIQRSFERIGTAVVAELTTATTAIVASVAKSLESADAMGKFAQKTGLTVEQFSGLAYAAKLVDVPVEALSKSFVILSKNLEKSSEQTQQGKAAHSAMATLFRGNIPIFKDTNAAFEDIVARLAILPEGFQRVALGAQIFGKGFEKIAPLVFEGVDAMHKAAAEAASFGLVLSDKTVRAATEFNETIKKITSVFEGLSLQLAQKLLPYLQKLADQFLDSAKDAQSFNQNIEVAATAVKILATGVTALWGSFKFLGDGIGFALGALATMGNRSIDLKTKLEIIKKADQDWEKSMLSTVETIQNLWVPSLAKADTAGDEHAKHGQALVAINEKLKKTYDDIVKKLSEEITTLTLGSAAVQLFKLQAEGATKSQLAFVSTLEKMVTNLKEGRDAFTGMPPLLQTNADLIDKVDDSYAKLLDRGFKAWEAARTPLERYSKEVADLKVLLDAHIIDIETYNRLTNEWGTNLHLIGVKVDGLKVKIGTELRSGIEATFNAALFGTGKVIDVFKSLIVQIGEAIVKMLILKPLFDFASSGGFGGFIGSLFSGLPAFASGGPVGGGQPIMVGEQGPEMFIPAMSGRIVPNNALGGGVNITYQIDARGSSITEEQFVRSLQATENRAVQRAVGAGREAQLRT
jgi:hypothetical protein